MPWQSSKPAADLSLEKAILPALFSVLTSAAGGLLLSTLILQRRVPRLGPTSAKKPPQP